MGCYLGKLNSKTKENTQLLSLNGLKTKGKIVYIYDGDTMHIVFKKFGHYYRWNCRIIGVDTPELRTKNKSEKELGYKVKEIVEENFLNRIVNIHCYDFDKYGRLLVDIVMPKHVVNPTKKNKYSEWLIDNNYGQPYDGGKKKEWIITTNNTRI